jgi:hypothetical protein
VSSTISDDENNQVITSSISQLDLFNENDDEILHCRTSKLAVVTEQKQRRFVKREALWMGTITILIDNFTETYSNITYSYTEVTKYEYSFKHFISIYRIHVYIIPVDILVFKVVVYHLLFTVRILILFKHHNSFLNIIKVEYLSKFVIYFILIYMKNSFRIVQLNLLKLYFVWVHHLNGYQTKQYLQQLHLSLQVLRFPHQQSRIF